MAYHWQHADSAFSIWDGRRSALTKDVSPGERIRMDVGVEAPRTPGRYKLVFDLVHELVRWFGVDRQIEVDIEEGVREHLSGATGQALVSITAARAARRRLYEPDGLANAMSPDQDEELDSPVSLPSDGWALNRAALNYLLAWIRRAKFTRILEFGSGVSTVVFARELVPREGALLSLDQDPVYANSTSQLLAEFGLAVRTRVLTVGLAETQIGGVRTLCYDLTPDIERDIRAFNPDLIVIDGPSQKSGASRLAVALMLANLLERPTAFAMDDAFRDAELEIADRWQRDPRIEIAGIVAKGKGLLVGRLRGGALSAAADPTHCATQLSGCYTFYTDPRAISVAGHPLVGAVGAEGSVRAGWFREDGLRLIMLHDRLEADDHGNPAFLIRNSDSRILAFYSRHAGPIGREGADATYLRISTCPNDPTSWDEERNLGPQLRGIVYGYANPVQLSGELNEPIYNFIRSATDSDGTCMHYSKSEDGGITWAAAAKLAVSRGSANSRPYFRVAQNGNRRIDFCINDGHPNERATNSVYHFYYEDGAWFASGGANIGAPPFIVSEELTMVFDGTTAQGTAWVWGIAINESRNPVIVYAVFPTPDDHRYRYARWTGQSWDNHEVTAAGGSLYTAEPCYSGGICIDPENVNVVYYARKINDVFQICKGVTTSGGATWIETQLTDGTNHCFRPYVLWGLRKLCYVSGIYSSYTKFDANIQLIDIA